RERTPVGERATGDAIEPVNKIKEGQSEQFKNRANLGVGGGIVTMLLASGIVNQGPDSLLVGAAISLGGWAVLVWGCVNYMSWNGYSGWCGLFGYLLLLGLLILVCFPNRRKRLLDQVRPEEDAARDALAVQDRQSGYRYFLTVVPLGILFLWLASFLG